MSIRLAPIAALAFLIACGGTDAAQAVIGPSCRSNDAEFLCLGLKLVAYQESGADPVLSAAEALENLTTINRLWAQCNIGFQIEGLFQVQPAVFGLRYQTANREELDDIRSKFNDRRTLLVVTTGEWDRSGTLGRTGANAWTAMPGGGPYGVIMEEPVSTYGNIIAHEIGHYLNLMHARENNFLMNPIIYKSSTFISSSDCSVARDTARQFWSRMLR